MRTDVFLSEIFYLSFHKIFEFRFLDGSSFSRPQNFTSSIDTSHDVEETGRILSSSIEFVSVIDIPFIWVTLSITGASFPVLNLIGPVDFR